jgi:hypothetical protein
MQFEVIEGGRWQGISRPSGVRLPDWRRIQPAPALEAVVRDAGYGRGYRRDLYAQAWSLVYDLRVQRPAEFLTFLDLLRSPDATLAELAPGERWLAAFRRAFGTDLAAVEREWHQYMNKLQTPLERHAPSADSDLERSPKPKRKSRQIPKAPKPNQDPKN